MCKAMETVGQPDLENLVDKGMTRVRKVSEAQNFSQVPGERIRLRFQNQDVALVADPGGSLSDLTHSTLSPTLHMVTK